MGLAGKKAAARGVIVVTGGSRGIGAATARALARAGGQVIATSRDAPSRRVRPRSGRVTRWQLDVRSERSVTRLFEDVDALGRELVALVNNAGLGRFGPLAETSAADFRAVVATNLTGAFLCSREALRRMLPVGRGRIVNVGSIAENAGFADCAAYAASKAGLRALSDAIRVEGRSHGVLVTHVVLGAVATAIWSDRPGFDLTRMLTPAAAGDRIAGLVLAADGVAIEEVRLVPPAGTLEPES